MLRGGTINLACVQSLRLRAWPLTAGHSGMWLRCSDTAPSPAGVLPVPAFLRQGPVPCPFLRGSAAAFEKAARQAACFSAPPRPPPHPRVPANPDPGARRRPPAVSCGAMGPRDAPRHPVQGPRGSAARPSFPGDSQPLFIQPPRVPGQTLRARGWAEPGDGAREPAS